jgi:hypothetical protein
LTERLDKKQNKHMQQPGRVEHGPCGRASKGRAGEAPSRPLQMRWQGRVPTLARS